MPRDTTKPTSKYWKFKGSTRTEFEKHSGPYIVDRCRCCPRERFNGRAHRRFKTEKVWWKVIHETPHHRVEGYVIFNNGNYKRMLEKADLIDKDADWTMVVAIPLNEVEGMENCEKPPTEKELKQRIREQMAARNTTEEILDIIEEI